MIEFGPRYRMGILLRVVLVSVGLLNLIGFPVRTAERVQILR